MDTENEDELGLGLDELGAEAHPEIVEDEPVVETQEETQEQPEEQPPEPETLEAEPVEPSIPPSRLREEADKRREAEAREIELRAELAAVRAAQTIQTQQKPDPTPVEAPDRWENPEAYDEFIMNQATAPIQEQMRQMQINLQRTSAMAEHGAQAVSEATQWAQQAELSNPALGQKIAQSPNPFAAAVAEHKQHTTMQQLGDGGVDGFKQRALEEALKDPEFLKRAMETAQAQAVGVQPTTPSIPSINGATGAVSDKSNGKVLPEGDFLESL